MQISDKGLLALARREALVLSTYSDSKKIKTIGIGHTAAAGAPIPVPGLTITPEQGIALFRKDLRKYETEVIKAVKVPLKQHQFDALVSFHFNTGGIARAALTKRLNAGDIQGAGKAFMGWLQPPEIKERREEEMNQFLTGDYGPISRIPVYDKYPGPKRWISAATVLSPTVAASPVNAAPVNGEVAGEPPWSVEGMMQIQEKLKALGYDPKGIDGRYGPLTAGAVARMHVVNGTTGSATGIERATADFIFTSARPASVQVERATAAPAVIAEKVPEAAAARRSLFATIGDKVVGFGVAVTAIFREQLGDTITAIKPVTDALGDIPRGAILAGLAILGGIAILTALRASNAANDAYREGKL